ncbi:hypothetical protein BDN70DRAFT_997765 [Pholiota conissans]|uniref:DUF6533 domain-containing protein n=1 Tax=Pholiota conissans TaxID=109636 RepID=A0A9P6CNT4_9AGAR|nr:hypothetical protein BDN70DRAFT_997765 [Pholiota conissans]
MVQLAGEHLESFSREHVAVAHRHTAQHARLFPALDTLLHDAFIVNLCCVAALTWLVYDCILCFPKEVHLVWGRWFEHKGRHTRRIYVIVRYASILNLGWWVAVNASSDLSLNVCNTWPYLVVITTSVATLLPDIMLLIRINAVYSWRVRCLLATAALFFIQLITSLGIGFVYVSSTTSLPHLGMRITGCVVSTPTLPAAFTLAAWIPSIVAQCIYFALVVTPFVSITCSLDSNGRLTWTALRSVSLLIPTIVVFANHGVIYFIITIATKIATAALFLSQSGPLQAVGIPWLIALYPVLIGRLYLAMVEHLHFQRKAPFLPPSRSAASVRLSYASVLASPQPTDNGPITFAVRASLSQESLSGLDLFEDEF